MITVFLLGFFCVVLLYFDKDKDKALMWAFGFITLFLGIRYDWGNDYEEYLTNFQLFSQSKYSLFDIERNGGLYRNSNEWGWVFLNRLFGKLGIGFFGFVMVLSVFENWIVYRTIKKYVKPKYYWISILFFVFSTSFCINASMMRQYLCMCLYLFVIDLMSDKKVKWYLYYSIGIIIFGSTIHTSCILMLATLPLFYINVDSKKTVTILSAIIGLAFLFWHVVGISITENILGLVFASDLSLADYANYVGGEKGGGKSFGFGVLFNYLMFVVWLFLLPQTDKKYQTIIILGLLSYFFEVAAEVAYISGRLALYFNMVDVIRWPLLFLYAKKWNVLYGFFAVRVIILLMLFRAFFSSATWAEKFSHFHTIFEVGQWL